MSLPPACLPSSTSCFSSTRGGFDGRCFGWVPLDQSSCLYPVASCSCRGLEWGRTVLTCLHGFTHVVRQMNDRSLPVVVERQSAPVDPNTSDGRSNTRTLLKLEDGESEELLATRLNCEFVLVSIQGRFSPSKLQFSMR